MSTERKLLELAAKAAGMEVRRVDTEYEHCFKIPYSAPNVTGWEEWNPLTDDGDALRLAVKLHMDINFFYDGCDDQYDIVRVHTHGAECDAEEGLGFYIQGGQIDEDAATRRAIVRAAAAIGETMP